MIISLVRSLPEAQIDCEPDRRWLRENLGFVTDEHQINVALTRAKQGLCIIGKMGKKWSISYCVSTDQLLKVKRKQSLPFPKYQHPNLFIFTLCQFFFTTLHTFLQWKLLCVHKVCHVPPPAGCVRFKGMYCLTNALVFSELFLWLILRSPYLLKSTVSVKKKSFCLTFSSGKQSKY